MDRVTAFGLVAVFLLPAVVVAKDNAQNWGKPVRKKAEIYAASDVPQSHIALTKKWYEIAAKEWGNYGPLEFWSVGSDVEAAKQLDSLYCRIRKQKDPKLDEEGCRKRSHNFQRYAKEGNAGLNTQRNEHSEWSGFIVTMASKNPGPQEEDYKSVTLHEYFHVYQHAHIVSRQQAERESRTQKNPWWMEGGAEYMAQLLCSRQPNVSDNHLRNKMMHKLRSIEELEKGESIRDIPYGRRGHIAYDLGAWFVAYVIHKSSEEAFRIGFFKDLNELGFEDAFEKNLGASSRQRLQEFHEEFLRRSMQEKLDILP